MRFSFRHMPRRRLMLVALVALALLAAPFAFAARRPRRVDGPRPEVRRVLPRPEVSGASPAARPAKPSPSAPEPTLSLTHESLVPLRLEHAAFPNLPVPGALVYIPAGIDRARPLDVVVFVHGWNGCAAAVASDAQIPCRPQGPRRGALDLVGQFRASGRAAVLVIPQMALERRTGDAGRLGAPNGFRLFLREVLAGIAPQVGARSVDSLGRVILSAHSGGFEAALMMLKHGGVTVDQLVFFDAFYAGTWQVAHWLQQTLEQPSLGRRFVSVYRDGAAAAGTRDLHRALRPALVAAGRTEALRSRATPGRITLDEASATIALVRTPGDHQQSVRWNLATVLRGADLAPVVR